MKSNQVKQSNHNLNKWNPSLHSGYSYWNMYPCYNQYDVSNILEAIQKSAMKVKPSKCEFHQKEAEYLGIIISENGVKAAPVKTQEIWDWTTPKTEKEIQCFLGFCNFYRRFIEDFSRMVKPLYHRTRKEYPSQMGIVEERTDSIQQTEDKTYNITGTSPLHTRGTNETRQTDASKYVCSGILSPQYDDGKWPPVAYRSKTMQDAECSYNIHDKELLAIIQAFTKWKRYSRGSPDPIKVLTDYKNLVTCMSTKEFSELQARWQRFLSQYNFKIKYRPGQESRKPDALTRRAGDLPTAGDKRLTRNVGILLLYVDKINRS